MHGEAVGGDAEHDVADLLPAVEGERQSLEVGVEGSAQIVDHALADTDRRVVVQEGQRPPDELDKDNPETGETQERERRPAFEQREARRFAAQDVVDDHLQRPRFQELEPGDQEDLGQGPGKAPPIGPQIGQ